MNKKISRLFAFALCTLVFASCGKYNYNEPVTEEDMAKNERVWGEVGGPPRQAANEYPADPELATKSSALREKMFYDDWGLNKAETAEDLDTDAPTEDSMGTEMMADSAMVDSTDMPTEE